MAALEAGRSDALVRYLETASRFHTYSFRNQCLIAAQQSVVKRGFRAFVCSAVSNYVSAAVIVFIGSAQTNTGQTVE